MMYYEALARSDPGMSVGSLGETVSLGLHETLCKPFKYFQRTCTEMKHFFKSLKTLCQIDLNIHLSAHNR